MKIQTILMSLQDKEYANFQSRLIPTIKKENVIGIRVPALRKLAKAYVKDLECVEFLRALPHKYYDENMLHALLISEIKDYTKCLEEVEKFLPYVDNWAVCDIMSPTSFKNHKMQLLEKFKLWINSHHVYTIRFGIKMLMTYFLEQDFEDTYLALVANVCHDDYYVKMMIAWFFATALAKKWEQTIMHLEEKKLDPWIHNKTIQKACESYRITNEQKAYLKTLKIISN